MALAWGRWGIRAYELGIQDIHAAPRYINVGQAWEENRRRRRGCSTREVVRRAFGLLTHSRPGFGDERSGERKAFVLAFIVVVTLEFSGPVMFSSVCCLSLKHRDTAHSGADIFLVVRAQTRGRYQTV